MQGKQIVLQDAGSAPSVELVECAHLYGAALYPHEHIYLAPTGGASLKGYSSTLDPQRQSSLNGIVLRAQHLLVFPLKIGLQNRGNETLMDTMGQEEEVEMPSQPEPGALSLLVSSQNAEMPPMVFKSSRPLQGGSLDYTASIRNSIRLISKAPAMHETVDRPTILVVRVEYW
jgi:hypothetical protein